MPARNWHRPQLASPAIGIARNWHRPQLASPAIGIAREEQDSHLKQSQSNPQPLL